MKLASYCSNFWLLRHADLYRDTVVISTETNVYEHCQIILTGDFEVWFNDIHPLTGEKTEYQMLYSSVKTVENITNNDLMWFQQPMKVAQ